MNFLSTIKGMETIELKIRTLLNEGLTSADIVVQLSDRLLDPEIKDADRHALFAFIMNAGMDRHFLNIVRQCLVAKTPLSWSMFIEVLARQGQTPSPFVMEAFFKGAKRQGMENEIILARSWDTWDKRFAERREDLIQDLAQKARKQIDSLKEKLQFLRDQRMVEQEQDVLQLLMKLAPEDPEVKQEHQQFSERWARHMISNKGTLPSPEERMLERWTSPLNAEEQKWIQFQLEEIKTITERNPDSSYDFALFLGFMEAFAEGQQALQKAPSSEAKDWLNVEFLVEARRFIEALDELNNLEAKYGDNSETTFAVSYLRAKSYHGLGQSSDAMEVLKSLINLRPHYRAAQSLLLQWSKVPE